MRPHTTKIFGAGIVCVLIASFFPNLATFSTSAAQGSEITLSSLHGYTAKIANYNDGVPGFCFTLTNTSTLPITAIGADLDGVASVNIVSQTETDTFRRFNVDNFSTINGIRFAFVLSSLDGLGPGTSNTFCITTGLGASDDEIAHNLFVNFKPVFSLSCLEQTNFSGRALLNFTRATETEQCVIITNNSPLTVTGVALDLTDVSHSFDLLSVTPKRQPFNQHLRFSEDVGRLDDLGDVQVNFAILAGGQFSHPSSKNGIQPNETSSEFCIGGTFTVLDPTEVERRTYVRFDDKTSPCDGGTTTGGQTGILAGEPR